MSIAPSESSQLSDVHKTEFDRNTHLAENFDRLYPTDAPEKTPRWYTRKRNIAAIALVVLAMIFLAVFLPVFLVLTRKHEIQTGGLGSGIIPNPNSPSGAVVSYR